MKIQVTYEGAKEMAQFQRFCDLHEKDSEVAEALEILEGEILSKQRQVGEKEGILERMAKSDNEMKALRAELSGKLAEKRDLELQVKEVEASLKTLRDQVGEALAELERLGRQKVKYAKSIEHQGGKNG